MTITNSPACFLLWAHMRLGSGIQRHFLSYSATIKQAGIWSNDKSECRTHDCWQIYSWNSM